MGTLVAGDKLPGTRELAAQLGVSRKTVLQAYLELAADNWVETRPGSCTYVLDRSALTGSSSGASAFPMLEVMAPEVPDETAETTQMDWGPYTIEGRFFGKPLYKDRWHSEEEWISFSRAIPDVRLFPFERIKKVSSQMLWDPQAYFFDYGHPQGYMPLLEYIEMRLAKEGVELDQSDLFICSGFQVALNLLLTLLLKPGETVVVEDPTFNSILNMLNARGIAHRGVPMEPDGLDIDYLDRLLNREKPRLIITIPTLHNPTGINMSYEKRTRLIELAQRHRVPVIEDQWAMLLGQDGKREPSLKALDTGGHVIQIGSFSKSFLPGTRVAWVALHRDLGVSFVKIKRAIDRSDSYFLQTLVHEFIRKGFMDLHCRKVDRIYRARRDLMDELMHQHFPSEVNWKKPSGGFSFWLTLPSWLKSMDYLKETVKCGVEFAPGNYFYVGRRDSSNLRLAFSTLTQPQLRLGIKRLGSVLTETLAQHRRQASGES
ncbi:PLP-dependent aminotransferase family protein [bacterium]|nr:PLP-dependent aminotransferase family protein [bacterium]